MVYNYLDCAGDSGVILEAALLSRHLGVAAPVLGDLMCSSIFDTLSSKPENG